MCSPIYSRKKRFVPPQKHIRWDLTVDVDSCRCLTSQLRKFFFPWVVLSEFWRASSSLPLLVLSLPPSLPVLEQDCSTSPPTPVSLCRPVSAAPQLSHGQVAFSGHDRRRGYSELLVIFYSISMYNATEEGETTCLQYFATILNLVFHCNLPCHFIRLACTWANSRLGVAYCHRSESLLLFAESILLSIHLSL